MKKGVVIVLAVAIIGALGIYGKSNGASGSSSVLFRPSGGKSGMSNTLGSSTSSSSNSLKDGIFTGSGAGTPYGTVQVAVVVSGGKISNVNFLQLPSDLGHSQEVSAYAAPLLKQETLQNQNAHVDFVTGATSTSMGYMQSLQSALNKAASSASNSSPASSGTSNSGGTTGAQPTPSGGFGGENEE